MSGADYRDLKILYDMDPDGPLRDNYHIGMLLAQQANISSPKNAKKFKPQDFVIGQYTPQQTKSQKLKRFSEQIKQQKSRQNGRT